MKTHARSVVMITALLILSSLAGYSVGRARQGNSSEPTAAPLTSESVALLLDKRKSLLRDEEFYLYTCSRTCTDDQKDRYIDTVKAVRENQRQVDVALTLK